MAEININNNPKVIAYYLPQYHSIPENDKAWGKGFTEWTNTRKAKPLFDGHYQPRTPLNNNYYDLNNPDVMVWQSNLAQKYGVFGFCYYHYWFKNGKKLLEMPIEKMLNDDRITIPFCLSWANENWSKLWDGGNKELIAEQDYGGKNEWKDHLEYLIQFFKDPRYITLDGAPIFLIYKPELIPHVQDMLKYWQSLAPEYGFNRFCFMIQNSEYYFMPNFYLGEFSYQIKFPPYFCVAYHAKNMNIIKLVQRIFSILRLTKLDKFAMAIFSKAKKFKNMNNNCNNSQIRLEYDYTWNILLKSETAPFLIEGALVDWDNTARKINGLMHKNACPAKFTKYMSLLFKKIKMNKQQPIIFLNAWNEWGEGAYLEPDEKYQYGYLEALKSALDENI